MGPACLGHAASQFVDYTAPAALKAKAWIELISLGTVNITKRYTYFNSFKFGYILNHYNRLLPTLHKHDQSFLIH